MAMEAFVGAIGNNDWATDQRPKNWRQGILFLYPNGDAPLTAIMSKMSSEATDDPQYHWWTKTLPNQAATPTGKYTDLGLSSAYTSGGVAGDIIYIKMSEADCNEFVDGLQVLLRYSEDARVDVNGKVVGTNRNGANSFIAVKLLEADDNSPSYDLSDCDRVLIIGNINPELGEMPTPVSYKPEKFYNYTQIWRTPLEIARTAKKTKLRTGSSYDELVRETLQIHGLQMERSALFGIATEGIGGNNKPERTTEGIITTIRNNASANVSDYRRATGYTTKSWVEGGEDWLDGMLEVLFRFGSDQKLSWCGSGALHGLAKLAKVYGNIQLTPRTLRYGLKILEWATPSGVLMLKRHPLFSFESTLRYSMLIHEPERMKWRFMDDTDFYPDPGREKKQGGHTRLDGIKEEYLTEGGYEFHFAATSGFFDGVGRDGVDFS